MGLVLGEGVCDKKVAGGYVLDMARLGSGYTYNRHHPFYLQINICATGMSQRSCNVCHKSRPGGKKPAPFFLTQYNLQVHPIPYHQSPLTMLLREALSVERMRQTKVVDAD